MFSDIRNFAALRANFTILGDCPHADPDLGYTGGFSVEYNPLGMDPSEDGSYPTSWSGHYEVNTCNSAH
eukprot:CAMPEP_0196730986 /NCGR_PEP_ID=MMETSP1091-20130531/10885_1 /TAXON_ID=302021 /ORGANISM="Rhodomonas sp., Strain CCMP768" /LENGTH=68 /DNA_ID=CAMNT_0042074085 /DNA_START=25 /DNA_END=231 /DNA_ORIENTATION=-